MYPSTPVLSATVFETFVQHVTTGAISRDLFDMLSLEIKGQQESNNC